MNQESRQLLAFMKAIEKNPRDVATRLVFADFLDDIDEPELAKDQRDFDLEVYDAQEYLKKFCERNNTDYDAMVKEAAHGEYYFGDDGGPHEARTDPVFKRSMEIVLGKEEMDQEEWDNQSFRCGC